MKMKDVIDWCAEERYSVFDLLALSIVFLILAITNIYLQR